MTMLGETTTPGRRWLSHGGVLRTVWSVVLLTLVTASVDAQSSSLVCDNNWCNQTFSVPENIGVGSYVGTVGHNNVTGGLPFADFIENVNPSNPDARGVFSVDLSTGRIVTTSALDRETVPSGRYIFFLRASAENVFVLVTVNLLDVNDNSPAFSPTSRQLDFSESAPLGAKKALGSVTDRDLGANSTQTCEIVSGNLGGAFTLLQKPSGEYDIILDLKVNARLDYETVSSYNLVIRATDGGGRTGEMAVRVDILDVNDNQPSFTNSKYQVRVAENVDIGTSLIRVEATDQDSGPNGQVRYSIDSSTGPEGQFRIDPVTGVVRVNKPLDYEATPTIRLGLAATDGGPIQLVGNAALEVHLQNINEQPANIVLTFLQTADRQGRIPENTGTGTPVARFSIEDSDIAEDRQDEVNVTLLGGGEVFGLQIADQDLSLVVVNTPPDRENKSVYDLTIVVTDAGTPPLRASRSFLITIEDVNDNAPQFSNASYHGEVLETADIGTSILRVSATDPDEEENSRITYSIEGSSSPQSGWFAIDSSTGVVTTRSLIDCELNAQPQFVVTARDRGDPPLSGSTTVVIVVRDVNDKQPEFETSFYNARVSEDAPVGDCPIEVHATDPECANAQVTYALVQNGDVPQELRVDETSGQICIQHPGLDYEKSSSYQFLVQAVDRDGLSTSAVVQVTVTDVNDNSPYFDPVNYFLSVESSVTLGPLLTVRGADRDSGDFGTVSYSFVNDNGGDFFRVDSGSGTISLVTPFPSDSNPYFQLKVQGTDRGGRVSDHPAVVEIRVYSGQVHPPTFTVSMYNFTVAEDVEVGELVGQVEATVASSSSSSSSPSPSSAGIQYSIDYSTSDWFRIAPTTGHIYTKGPLDREAQQFVLLVVQANTTLPQVLYSTAQVNLTLLDVNDNWPIFPASSMLQVEVREGEVPQHPVYIAHAHDSDAGNNGTIRYRLGNDPENLFDIDEVSGEVYLHHSLDYEQSHSHRVVIIAEDQGSAVRRSSNMTLTVNVKDINDNGPVFTEAEYDFYVSEGAPIGFEFGNVTATDADSDQNGGISYSLEPSPHQAVFGIFTVQGVLTTRDRLDRETQDLYTLAVIATDHGVPAALSATATVRIHVTDTNDNDPEFSRASYKFSIAENRPRNSLVGQVSATDRDDGDNRRLRYQLSMPHDNFTIDADSGMLTTLVSLDREWQADPLDPEWKAEYTLKVYVRDWGTPERQASVTVKVQVLDENDNAPDLQLLDSGGEVPEVWQLGLTRVNVSENLAKGQLVARAVARDMDAGENGTVSFGFDAENTDEDALHTFSIHPTTGRITTDEVLDYETQTQYRLIVTARDNGHPRQSQSQLIIVDVLNDDGEVSLSHAEEVELYVAENVLVGTVVGELLQYGGGGGQMEYHLLGGNVFGVFSVGRYSGDIRTVKEVDYEQASSHTLYIQAVEYTATFPHTSNVSVVVHVMDVNDNPPVFDNDPVFINTVSEHTRANQVVHTFVATDRDSGPNGTVRYSIVSESASGPQHTPGSFFRISPSTGELSLTRPVDYEQVHTVALVIRAEDGCPVPSLALSSLVTAVVSVVDVNDNAPVFQSVTEVRVFEDEAVGFPVALLVAVDGDSNQDDSGNNVVNYIIVSGNKDGNFRLDPVTGLLTIHEALDRETRPLYVLNVSAEDCGVPKMATHQELRVYVEDVNDNAPLFQQAVYHSNVSESSPAGTPVATVTATDGDQGRNGNVTYTIPQGIAGDRFTVGSTTGIITTTQPLDREQQAEYTVTVVATDGGYPSLYGTATVVVTVSDVNDHTPAFDTSSYVLQLPENRPLSDIVTVVADDLDEGVNAEIVYSITDGNDGSFEVDPRSGQLSCRALDRESRHTYTLTVTATDSGTPPRSSSTQVRVTVQDDNDNRPQFSQTTYTASMTEDVAQGHTVLQVSATDPDEGRNGEVAYSLLGNDTEGLFSVNSTSGDIITSGVFDREKNASFDFQLVASDRGGSGPRNSTVRVRIIIRDVNDNAPTFRQVPYKVNVSESLGSGQVIVEMTADDPDSEANGSVRYELQDRPGGSSATLFHINPSSGVISTRTSLAQARGFHHLLVLASDQGSPALTTTGVVEITVGNTNGPPPLRFDQDTYVVPLQENAADGSPVVTVTATNTGSDAVTYSIVNGNDRNTFRINSQTGQVQVASPSQLDYESTPKLELIVAAAAGGSQAYAKVQVDLRDENDNDPKFAQTEYVSALWENNQPQTTVTQVWAKDADSGVNGHVIYNIIGGNDYNVFEIFPQDSGIVRTNIDSPRLDREISASYTLLIEAQDHGFPPRSSTCILNITIVDENDNAPNFPNSGRGSVTIAESGKVGKQVAVVTATDVDLNPFLLYDFSAQGNPEGTFSLDRATGTLRLARRLDHEARPHYTVGLQVTDGQHTVQTTLEVLVSDINDNAPRFSQASYQAVVPGNAGVGVSVLTVRATDADDGANRAVTYSLRADVTLPSFAVDPGNGTIFTSQRITSSSARSVAKLVVLAQDGGSPSLSAMAVVYIHIAEVNSFSPRFSQTNYSATVSESQARGTELLQVQATDNDYSPRTHTVRYVLKGPFASAFYMQGGTGRILLNGHLDYEESRRYDLLAMAVDDGTPSRNATVPVTIHVTDANDNAPAFLNQRYSATLVENYPENQTFLTVNATDRDTGASGRLEYSITSGNANNLFAIRSTGGLVVLSSLDYEMQPSHRLIVKAVDCVTCRQGAVRLSAFVTVTVYVTDINEFTPTFPVEHYFATVAENQRDTFMQVQANDQDRGQYGEVTYQILPGLDNNLFWINRTTGALMAKRAFDFENPNEPKEFNITVQAVDTGGLSDTVGVTIRVTDVDEYTPQFLNKSYSFTVAGSAKTGAYVGTIQARDGDGGRAGRLLYTFDHPVDYFQLDVLSGNVTVSHTLHDDVPREEPVQKRRKKRALVENSKTLIVRVSSGADASRSATVFCVLNVDRQCPGCQIPLPQQSGDKLGSVAIAMIVLVCILVPVIIIVLLLVFIYRRRKSKSEPATPPGESYGGQTNTLGITPPPLDDAGGLPAYKDVLQYGPHLRAAKITNSDFSEQSHNSASSGRGSVEVEDEDEEIRRINATNYLTNSAGFRHKTMPDSGIQQDDDNLSEPAATNHQDYLARLGIDPKIGKTATKRQAKAGSTTGSDMAFSEHAFTEEGGGEDGVDFGHLTDTDVDEEMVMIENSRHQLQAMSMAPVGGMAFQAPEPQQAGTLSNVVNSEEEYSGSYNWDYLLDWGPQYQPLAQVFSEIAKLKDESVTPKKTPVKTVPQRRINGGQGLAVPQARIVPPPIITSAPPPLAVEAGGEDSGTGSEGGLGSRMEPKSAMSSSSSSGGRSQRGAHPLPSLPRSPISYEDAAFNSTALTPSFTPSLSPLGTHTPSLSDGPAGHYAGEVHGHAGAHGSSVASPHSHPHPHPHPHGRPVSGHHHQHHHHHRQHNHPHHYHARPNPTASNVGGAQLTLSASSDSEREFRI